MSIDEFYKTPEWHRLSAKQKFFIQSYLASGNNDQVFATNCAYDMATDESARTASYHIMRQKKIQAALNRYWNKGSRELILEDLERDIAAAKPKSAAKRMLQRLYSKVLTGGKLPRKKGARP
jgi:hypothetical protein